MEFVRTNSSISVGLSTQTRKQASSAAYVSGTHLFLDSDRATTTVRDRETTERTEEGRQAHGKERLRGVGNKVACWLPKLGKRSLKKRGRERARWKERRGERERESEREDKRWLSSLAAGCKRTDGGTGMKSEEEKRAARRQYVCLPFYWTENIKRLLLQLPETVDWPATIRHF